MDSRVSANEAIDDYIRRGWSIIPIRTGDKRPLVRWHEFQHRRPSVEEVRAWFSDWPEAWDWHRHRCHFRPRRARYRFPARWRREHGTSRAATRSPCLRRWNVAQAVAAA